jgi:hypothetical protein
VKKKESKEEEKVVYKLDGNTSPALLDKIWVTATRVRSKQGRAACVPQNSTAYNHKRVSNQ